MKTIAILMATIALLSFLVLAVACGGDGGSKTADNFAGTPGRDASNPSGGNLYQPGQASVTVDGYGLVIAPVDTVILGFGLVLDSGFDPIGTPCPPDQPCPAPSVRSPASPPFSEEDLAPVLAAIKEQGISDEQTTVINRHGEPVSGAEIYVTVSDPRHLDPVVDAVSAATQASGRVALLTGAGISNVMSVDECLALEREAFDNALADARRRAQSLVEGYDVVVGDVISVEERSISSSCSMYEAIFDNEIGLRLPVSHYTSGQPAEESFVSEVTITFAVQ